MTFHSEREDETPTQAVKIQCYAHTLLPNMSIITRYNPTKLSVQMLLWIIVKCLSDQILHVGPYLASYEYNTLLNMLRILILID